MGSADAAFTLGSAILIVTKARSSELVSEAILLQSRGIASVPVTQRGRLRVHSDGSEADVRLCTVSLAVHLVMQLVLTQMHACAPASLLVRHVLDCANALFWLVAVYQW